MLPCALAVLSSFALVNAAYSQLAITSNIQSTTIDFDSNVGWENASPVDNPDTSNDVYRRTDTGGTNLAGNARWLLETNAFSTASSDFGLSSRAFSLAANGQNVTGTGNGIASPFGDNINGDGDNNDNFNVLSGARLADHSQFTGVNVGDFGLVFGNNGDTTSGGYLQPFRSYALTLRIQNVSGASISEWSVDMDNWWGDRDNDSATMSLAYSTDNVTFTTLDSFTTFNNSTTVSKRDLGGTFNANVADGSFLYVRVANLRPGAVANALDTAGGTGNGAMLIIDNWNVTAIPEPSTVAFFASALAGLAYLFFRNRRK